MVKAISKIRLLTALIIMFYCYENKKAPCPLIITKMRELDAVSQLILLGM